MLWLMRRPWIKRFQRASERWFPKAKPSMVRQNRWARRFGLRLLTFSFNVLVASMIVTAAYFVVLEMLQGGYLEGKRE